MSPRLGGTIPNWDDVLSSAARLQTLLPDAILVGGTAASLYASHRLSIDDDHVMTDLRDRFDEVLAQLESVAGCVTARVQRPVQILGSLDGIDTGIRQLIRQESLETTQVRVGALTIAVPTEEGILGIKSVLILKRNATRDYLDTVALVDHLGRERTATALRRFDALYPQENGQSPLQQLAIQLAKPLPCDIKKTDLSNYKNLAPQWCEWDNVVAICLDLSTWIEDDIVREVPVVGEKGFTV